MMENRKCPNCGGALELQKKRNQWVCAYCDSVFEAEEPPKKENGILREDMIYVDADINKLMAKNCTAESIKSLKYCMDELETAEKVEAYLRRVAAKDEDTAMQGIREERIAELRDRVNSELESGERVIIQVDTSLFGRGKEFYVVTDRACRFFTKKTVLSVRYNELVTMKINDSLNLPSFYLNGDYRKSVSAAGNSRQTLGVMIALITLLAFEHEPNRDKIRIV